MKLPFTPRDYQITDLARLISTPNTPLFHDPGAGKTPIAAMYCRYAFDALGYKSVWCMTSSLLDKNRMDILRFGGFEEHEVAVVRGTPGKRLSIMQDPRVKVFLMTGTGYGNEWGLLLKAQPTCRINVCDEIHLYYATHSSMRTSQWYQACRYMFSVIPMTGSVLKGRLNSAYPIFHALYPLYYGSYEAFMNHHALFDISGRVIGWKNHERLKELLAYIGIRRSFKEIYGEEKKVIQVHTVPLQGKHRNVYDKWKAMEVLDVGKDELLKAEGNQAQVTLRSRQILALPVEFGVMEKGYVPEKDVELLTYVEDAIYSGYPMVVFSVFKAEQERIVKLIQEAGGKVGLINGEVSSSQRTKVSEEYIAGKLQFVVASPATAGVGYNWHHTHTMIFATAEYSDDSFGQSVRRGIRGVRETPLRVIMMAYQNSIEEKILKRIDESSRDSNKVDETKEELTISHSKRKLKTKATETGSKEHNAGSIFSMENF